jgi:hypothetical protein
MKTVLQWLSSILMIICAISLSCAAFVVVAKFQGTALDFAIIGLIALLVGTGVHTFEKELK